MSRSTRLSARTKSGGSDSHQDALINDLKAIGKENRTSAETNAPLEIGTQVMCKHRDGTYRLARIIERRIDPQSSTQEYEYYVHYRNLNRRMDCWASLAQLDLDTVQPPVYEFVGAGTKKRRVLVMEHSDDEGEGHEEFDPQALREHEEFTKVKNIERIELGRYGIETWYFSPLPEIYNDCKELYFCEFDLAFFRHRSQMLRHLAKVRYLHPPGTEIYRHKGVSVFEVDGSKAKTYCQNLCYVAKMFLDHKALDNEVEMFLFYVVCECDERGAHITGYFSKEKDSENNLACILVLPPYQRAGYGKFLISFSYELTKLEGKVGTPERPLSDLGAAAYRSYWSRQILGVLQEADAAISIKELSDRTAIKPDDVISTLQHLKLLSYQGGKHVICAAPGLIDKLLKKCGSTGLQVEASKIVWSLTNDKLFGRRQ